MAVDEVAPPEEGLWRVGRAPDPLSTAKPLPPSYLDQAQLGNRFDSATGSYRVLYFSTTLQGCYGETLARFRPDPRLEDVVGDEWAQEGSWASAISPLTGVNGASPRTFAFRPKAGSRMAFNFLTSSPSLHDRN